MTDEGSMISARQSIDGGVLVVLSGEINFDRSPLLRNELVKMLQHDGVNKLVLDMASVEYMDSSAVAALVEVMQIQRRRRQKLILCRMQPKVKGIFEIARLDTVFTIVDDLDAAIAE